MIDNDMPNAGPLEQAPSVSQATPEDAKPVSVEFEIEDLAKRIVADIDADVAACGGCNGCGGCSM